jgi:metallo-beta-lactamase class B
MKILRRQILRLVAGAAALLAAAPLAAQAGAAGDCPVSQLAAGLQGFGATGIMPPDVVKSIFDPKEQRVPPFKAFDNVYFVGVCWVSAWLITDPAGDILIDTLHEPQVDTLIGNIAEVGAKLGDIRYVLVTRGHFDHAGGAAHLKPLLPNARFVTTQKGWDEAIASAENTTDSVSSPWTMIAPDIVAKDGDKITVGQTVVTVYETPGHTFGTASYGYAVRDSGNIYRAVTVGGLGLNAIKNVAQVEAYVASVKRLQAMAADAKDPILVSLTTHPPFAGVFPIADKLAARKAGEPNPFVDRAGFQAHLAQLLKNAQERLAIEKAQLGGK